jgi:hypothetical protein
LVFGSMVTITDLVAEVAVDAFTRIAFQR